MTDADRIAYLEAQIAKLRERNQHLERQTGALMVDRDRSVAAALLRAESCDEHGREIMHWHRAAEWLGAAERQKEGARQNIVTALIFARDRLAARAEPVPADEIARELDKAIDAQRRVKRQPDGWPLIEEFLHLGCACSTVPTDGVACWEAQGLLFGLPEDGTGSHSPWREGANDQEVA